MSLQRCDFEEPFAAPYTEITIFVIVFIILQALLLWHTLYYECKSYKEHSKLKRTKLSIRVTFIGLQLCGIYFTVIDLLRFTVDPYLKFVQQNSFSCSLIAYSPKVMSIIYFAIYLCQVLLRLEVSFRGSHLAIHKISLVILAFFIFLPLIAVPISFFALVNKPCIWRWEPIDITVADDFAFCDFHSEGAANTVIAFGVIWIVLANIVYGIIFGVKLNKVLRHNADVNNSFKLKSLIIKNTVLTTIGSISTLINWFMWLTVSAYTGIGISFLYLDMFFNCFVIALMFRYNERYYKILCKPCIVCCLMDCDRTYNKKNEKEYKIHFKQMNKYLMRKPQKSVSHIFSSTKELSTTPHVPSTPPVASEVNGSKHVDMHINLTDDTNHAVEIMSVSRSEINSDNEL